MPNLEQGPNFQKFMAEWNAEHPEEKYNYEKPSKVEKTAHSQKEVEEAFLEAGNIKEAAAKLDLEKTRANLRQAGQKERPNAPALMADRKAMSTLKPDATALKESKGFLARMLEKIGIKQLTVAEQEAAKQKKAEEMFGEKFMEKHEGADLRKSRFGSKQTLEEAEAEQMFANLEKGAKMQKRADYQAEVGEVEALGKKGREELREKMDKEAEEARIKKLLEEEGRRGTK